MGLRVAAVSIALFGLIAGTSATARSVETVRQGYPEGCAPREAARFVLGFLDAYNRGSIVEADRFFAPSTGQDPRDDAKDGELGFQWYSVSGPAGQRINADARDRATLGAYFGERHDQGERLDLLAIDLNYKTWPARGVGFGFLVRRRARDLPKPVSGKTSLTIGKAGINCPSQTMYNWSAGRPFSARLTRRSPRRVLLCPPPRRWKPSARHPLVCVSQRP